MVAHKTPARLDGDSWEIERSGSDDSLPCSIKKTHLSIVSDVEDTDWTARLVDVSLGNPDVKNASFFSVLIRRVERGNMGWVSETHPRINSNKALKLLVRTFERFQAKFPYGRADWLA